MSDEPKNLKQALDDIRGDLSPLRKDGNLYDELVDLRADERRSGMSERKPLSGHKFIRMMRPVLGLPENIGQIKIEATADGIVYIDLTMIPNDTDVDEESRDE